MHRSRSPSIIWFYGLPASGKTSLAKELKRYLQRQGNRVCLIDGDEVRKQNKNFGFELHQRQENIERIANLALFSSYNHDYILVAAITPLKSMRIRITQIVGSVPVTRIYCRAALAQCESRDPKGLYGLARRGLIKNFTGIDSPFEEEHEADIIIDTGILSLEDCLQQALGLLDLGDVRV